MPKDGKGYDWIIEWYHSDDPLRFWDYRHGKRKRVNSDKLGAKQMTVEKANDMRAEYAKGGTTHQRLADKHSISRGVAHSILSGRTWNESGRKYVDQAVKDRIIKLYDKGLPQHKIADAVGFSQAVVSVNLKEHKRVKK